jgi:hypothetical protein
MCKESEQKQETTEKTELPGWLNQASKSLVQQAYELGSRAFVPYEGDRVAEFTPDQQTGFQAVRDMISGAPDVLPSALSMAQAYADAPAQQISDFGRIIDENGKLGAISDYMSPYISGVLDPAIRKITEAADKARLGMDARMTMAGAFGDAQHGVEGSRLNREYQTAVGDTAGRVYADAWDKGMGLRGGDLSRFVDRDKSQAALNETALQRLLQGAGSLLNFQGADQNQELQRIAAILGTGQTQQANEQFQLDASFQEFLREMGWDADNLRTAASVISGAPHETTRTGTATTTQPDNSLWQLAGTLAGAVAAPFTGGMSLAIPGLMGAGGAAAGPGLAFGGGTVGPPVQGLPWLA